MIYFVFNFGFYFWFFAGKGNKVSFVLNQDFHSGYANENSTAYSILANSVKREVRFTIVGKFSKKQKTNLPSLNEILLLQLQSW